MLYRGEAVSPSFDFFSEVVYSGIMLKQLHATCIEIHNKGVLLTGHSGSGKSEVALRLMMMGARLIADDCVLLDESTCRASCPKNLSGKMEMRGVGIVPVACKSDTKICLHVHLCPRTQVERFPLENLETRPVPRIKLCGHDVAATADKIAFICQQKDIADFLSAAREEGTLKNTRKKNCPLPKISL